MAIVIEVDAGDKLTLVTATHVIICTIDVVRTRDHADAGSDGPTIQVEPTAAIQTADATKPGQ